MRACSEKKLSENTQLMLSAIIKNARIKSGELAADEKALELTELIKDKTEQEIIQIVHQLEK
jgi:hypothetical protein